jgi:hypothetical protein
MTISDDTPVTVRKGPGLVAVIGWLVLAVLLTANLIVQVQIRDDVREAREAAENASTRSGPDYSSELDQIQQRLREAPWPTTTPDCVDPPCPVPEAAR